MAVRSTSLSTGLLAAGVRTLIAVTPAGRTFLWRSLLITNSGALATTALVDVNGAFVCRVAIAAGATTAAPFFTTVPLDQIFITAAAACSQYGSGTSLLGAPS